MKTQSPKPTPLEAQRIAQGNHGYGPILLSREGDESVVSVQVGDFYVPVIREVFDNNVYHCVQPLGIEDEIVIFFAGREPLFEFTDMLDWVRTARWHCEAAGHSSQDTIAIDHAGRIISGGFGFQRAADGHAFPVKVYSTRDVPNVVSNGKKGARGKKP